MAEIEVLLDFGRPYVRLDDYNEMKERYWSQVTKTQDADGEAAKWQEHARAALARAEAAEAEAESAILVASDAAQREENAMHALSHFRARVAELEARAEAAERERDDANIEAALNQANAREAWARVAELEAALTGDIQAVVAKQRNPARS